jgi:hypothetical protein
MRKMDPLDATDGCGNSQLCGEIGIVLRTAPVVSTRVPNRPAGEPRTRQEMIRIFSPTAIEASFPGVPGSEMATDRSLAIGT